MGRDICLIKLSLQRVWVEKVKVTRVTFETGGTLRLSDE